MSKTTEDKYSTSISTLHWVLAMRLPFSRSWHNVSLTVKAKTFVIRWFDPKKPDPHGKKTFSSRVLPLSKRSLNAEIDRQIEKYLEEKRAT